MMYPKHSYSRAVEATAYAAANARAMRWRRRYESVSVELKKAQAKIEELEKRG